MKEMNGEKRRCGMEVSADAMSSALGETRQARLALDLLIFSTPGIDANKTLNELFDDLCAEETRELQRHGVPRQYLIVKPLDLLNLPDQAMQEIIAAIKTLARHGLLVDQWESEP
jgi:hypothetical protein